MIYKEMQKEEPSKRFWPSDKENFNCENFDNRYIFLSHSSLNNEVDVQKLKEKKNKVKKEFKQDEESGQ